MASLHNVQLHVAERQGSAFVEVSYRIDATHHDIGHGQSYRELVQLVGDDRGAGEDGVSELIVGGTIFEGILTFTGPQTQFARTRAKNMNSSLLDEDGPFREDEIRARVSLIPIPPGAVSQDSNLVRRGALVIDNLQPTPA